MASTARPSLSTWSVRAAHAVTAGSRVTEFVTPGPSRRREVAFAASASWIQTSGARFWLSGMTRLAKPRSSIVRAKVAARPAPAGARRPTSIAYLVQRRDVDAVEVGDVFAQDGAALLGAQARAVLLQQVLRPRPRRVAVREVVGPHQAAPVHHLHAAEGHPVVLERGVDALGEPLRRQSRERLSGRQPVPVPLPGVIHAVHVVRHPAGVGLDADDAQLRVALKDAAQ